MLSQYALETRPIVLVLDNDRIHSSKITLGGLAPFKDRLNAFFLPTYSPYLNIIELLWRGPEEKDGMGWGRQCPPQVKATILVDEAKRVTRFRT